MKNKHLPNRELRILNSETDFFGHIDKGDAITSFFKSNIDSLNQTNMIALYGKWGSGKSTLMKYIGTELEKDNYKSLYFPAWQFEKDDNLPLSLIHFISDETGANKEKIVKEFIALAGDALKAAVKSITLDAGVIKISGTTLINSADDFIDKNDAKDSVYKKTKKFKDEFGKAEKVIVKKTEKKKLIIFIDDLDRCEPENVLNLISVIKLFFTYSENIVFVFGCDKEAISKAVQHKYGEIIKAEEYLEKVIDVSFSMPNDISINRLLNHYFPGDIKTNEDYRTIALFLEDFLKSIDFTNPRQLKKILNKFEILRNFKSQLTLSSIQRDLIPNIIIDGQGDLMETVFTLYFIILHEFYPDTLYSLFDVVMKVMNYSNAYMNKINNSSDSGKLSLANCKDRILRGGFLFNNFSISFNTIISFVNKPENDKIRNKYNAFIAIFSPNVKINSLDFEVSSFTDQFYNKDNTPGDIIALKFCDYITRKKSDVLSMHTEYKIIDFFQMCRVLL